MRYFIDLTGTVGNREEYIVKSMASSRSDLNLDLATIVAIDGKFDAHGESSAVLSLPSGSSNVEVNKLVLDRLEQEISHLDADEAITVCSFNPVVEHFVSTNSMLAEGRLHFFNLREVFSPSAGNRANFSGWQDSFMPADEAVDYLVRALGLAGGFEHQANLRDRLKEVNPRFAKDKTNPAAFVNAYRFISLLVSLGERAQFVRSEGVSPNPRIILTEQGRGYASSLLAKPINEPGVQESASPIRESDRYLSILRSKNFGPFQEVREAIYDSMEKELDARPMAATVRELLYNSVDAVRKDVEEAQQTGRHHLVHDPARGYPWTRVRSFMSVLLTRCPVLRSDDELIGATWTELNRTVSQFDDNWRTKLDAEFVIFLLENGCVINMYSVEDLSGAIYNTRRPVGTEKVEECVRYLIVDAGRCTVSGNESKLILTRRATENIG